MDNKFHLSELSEEMKDVDLSACTRTLQNISDDIKNLETFFNVIPVKVYLNIDTNQLLSNEGGRVHYVHTELEIDKPLIECDRFIRLEMYKYLPELVKEVKKQFNGCVGESHNG